MRPDLRTIAHVILLSSLLGKSRRMKMEFSSGNGELTYANPNDRLAKRLLIRSVEEVSGRRRYLKLYRIWRRDVAPTCNRIFARMLAMCSIGLEISGHWPPRETQGPLVIVANHPFGIGDGIAILSLAEQFGRPFRVMINADLLKVSEIEPYSLPVDFSETREAMASNLEMRKTALSLIREGTIIVIFPAGGVATAKKPFGKAEDLPWKLFVARLVRESGADVLPIHFDGQNGWLFHLASRYSLTLRISLLIREFARLRGKTIRARVGEIIQAADLSALADRKELVARLHRAVFELEQDNNRPAPAPRRRPLIRKAA